MARLRFDYDLIVIGSGAAGSAAAGIAAKAGKNIAIVEADTLGGESSNWGDIPLKSMLHAATLYHETVEGSRFGIRSQTLGYNYPAMKSWKELAIKRTGIGSNRSYYEKQGISVYNNPAHFISPNEVSVGRRHLSAAQFLVATGSEIAVPDIAGIAEAGFLTPRKFIELTRLPKELVVIGGGDSGVEIAQLASILGSKVFLLESSAHILPLQDQEAGDTIEDIFNRQENLTVLTHATAVSIHKTNGKKRVIISRGGVERILNVDDVVITEGRRPNVDLGLDNAGVSYTKNGIAVNDYLQTSVSHIYAAGEVLGQNSHTHTALFESRIAAHNILNKKEPVKALYDATPHIVFTYPGVASVGKTEKECKREGLGIKTATAPISLIARSNTSDFRDGFVKIITDKKGTIIGATIVAPHAGEIIHELSLAIKYRMSAYQLAHTPHAFLSWSEAVRVAASKLV